MTVRSYVSGSQLSAKGLTLARRAELLWTLRSFFNREGFLELEPPSIVTCPGMEPHLDAFEVIAHHAHHNSSSLDPSGLPFRRWLHTSPEHALKRLLGEGFEKVYALGSCFRDEPPSLTHSPEFSMLEWYVKGADLEELMGQCERLIQTLASRAYHLIYDGVPSEGAHAEALHILRSEAFERLSVQEAFLRYAQVDLASNQCTSSLIEAATLAGIKPSALESATSWDEVYFQVFLDLVEPHLGLSRPVFLYDFPASQSALANINDEDPMWALRFELFYGGLELANAFDELTDPIEQRARFEGELQTRSALGSARYPIDEPLLRALPTLGQCVGIAVGWDRLIMALLDHNEISEVVAQPWCE